jgi:ABC-type uncharacterized transport system auxiliary subunit
MTRIRPAGLLAALALLGLTACAAPPVPRDHFYRLDITAPPSVGAAQRDLGIVAIDPFEADGQLRERPLLVAASTTETQQQDYHFWSDPPARMLQAALIDYMRQSGATRGVVTPQMRIDADLHVQARVKRLERRLADNTVVVELEIALTEPAGQGLILIDTYRAELPAADPSVAAAVHAINAAVGDIFNDFVTAAVSARQSAK